MNVVLYTEDFEPITVFDLPVNPDHIARYMGSHFRVPIVEPIRYQTPGCPMPAELEEYETLTIRLERLHWLRGQKKWVLIAEDEVLALKLRAAWLPGQQRQVNEYRRTIDLFSKALALAMQRGR